MLTLSAKGSLGTREKSAGKAADSHSPRQSFSPRPPHLVPEPPSWVASEPAQAWVLRGGRLPLAAPHCHLMLLTMGSLAGINLIYQLSIYPWLLITHFINRTALANLGARHGAHTKYHPCLHLLSSPPHPAPLFLVPFSFWPVSVSVKQNAYVSVPPLMHCGLISAPDTF